MEQMQAIDGRVTAVRGAVFDAAFEGATLPPIDDALLIRRTRAPDHRRGAVAFGRGDGSRDRFAIAKAA